MARTGRVRSSRGPTPGTRRNRKRRSWGNAHRLIQIRINFWLDDAREPDSARTVDVHRKPGYDPAEMFPDPHLSVPKGRIAWARLRKRLGFRAMMRVIGTDPTVVRGSHGHPPAAGPLFVARQSELLPAGGGGGEVAATDVCGLILRQVGIDVPASPANRSREAA